MSAKLLLGRPLADGIYNDVKKARVTEPETIVHVRGIIVGDDPASLAYQNIKEQACIRCNIAYSRKTYAGNISEKDLIMEIGLMNADQSISGIIVQLPLPEHLNRDHILGSVSQEKDIDAFFYTLGADSQVKDVYPPTPVAMLKLFQETGQSFDGKNVVVVGNGFLVGQPLIKMLKAREVQPLLVDNSTSGSGDIISQADVLFTGVGQPNLITVDMIKPGVIIIDAGYAKVDGKTYGDVDEKCVTRASFMTPSIGGVGPLTVACLIENTARLAHVPIS